MTFRKSTNQTLLALAITGLIAQQCGIAMAVELHSPQAGAQRSKPTVIGDVVVSEVGQIHGQVVDRQGISKARTAVTVFSRGGAAQQVITDRDGRFRASAPQGGLYSLAVGRSAVAVRVWTPQAAPPSAKRGVLLVTDELATRGQLPGGGGALLGVGLTAGILAVVIVEATEDNNGTPPGPPSS